MTPDRQFLPDFRFRIQKWLEDKKRSYVLVREVLLEAFSGQRSVVGSLQGNLGFGRSLLSLDYASQKG